MWCRLAIRGNTWDELDKVSLGLKGQQIPPNYFQTINIYHNSAFLRDIYRFGHITREFILFDRS